jgi:hypothetical protein
VCQHRHRGVFIEKIVDMNEYRSSTDFKILEVVFRIGCAKTRTNLSKIEKYVSILNADFIADELFEDTIKFESVDEMIIRIKGTGTMHVMQCFIRFVKYLKSDNLYD